MRKPKSVATMRRNLLAKALSQNRRDESTLVQKEVQKSGEKLPVEGGKLKESEDCTSRKSPFLAGKKGVAFASIEGREV